MLVKTCDQNHEGGGGKIRVRREERGKGRSREEEVLSPVHVHLQEEKVW